MLNLDTASSMERMIQQQIIDRGLSDSAVLGALRAIPRELFFPANLQENAYADQAASIGHGQTISQPYMVALMTERLKLQASHRVLEIGTGSGYQTAILAKLAGEVWTIERLKPLLDEAWERLMSLNLRKIHYRHGDGTLGWPQAAPFDRILITAGAPNLPESLLLDQLADDGLAIVPIGPMDRQILTLVHRNEARLLTTDICACRFVKLIGEHGWVDK